MMDPLVDFHFTTPRAIQIHLLFMLPEIDSSESLCTTEQLFPVSYQHDGVWYGGSIVRQD